MPSALEPLLDRLTPILGNVSGRARSLAGIAVIACILGLCWLGVAAVFTRDLIILAPALGLVVVGVLFLAAAALVAARASSDAGYAPGGAFLLGCSLGRRTVSCGALRVDGDASGLPRSERVSVLVAPETKRVDPAQRGLETLFDELVVQIRSVLTKARQQRGFKRFSSIGVATPGVVDLETGSLTLSVTVPDGTNVPWALASRLVEGSEDLVVACFGTQFGRPAELAKRVFVDNDVRCIARHELSHHGWRDFASLYVGGGVGAAIVIDGRVHYGAHGSAAHVGHVELEGTGNGLRLKTGQQLGPTRCDCRHEGFHFEPFANYEGLRRIAEVMADSGERIALDESRKWYAENGVMEVDFYRDGFPKLIAIANRASDQVPSELQALVSRVPGILPFAGKVLEAYCGVLASGIATLSNIVDPGRVSLSGPLAEDLRQNERFAQYLRDFVPPRLLDGSASPHLQGSVAGEALWQGAALLAWDPGYHQRRSQSARAGAD
jgi:predicted NBD/HSP70 family sugar kinase